MNVENVISLEAVGDLPPFKRVKMTATGVDYAGAADTAIGITLPGDLNRNYPSIQLIGRYAEAVMNDGTDIVRGDQVEAAAGGNIVKKNAGTAIGVAVSGGTEAGDRITVIYFL